MRVKLTARDKQKLNDKFGKAARIAMSIILRVAEVCDVDQLDLQRGRSRTVQRIRLTNMHPERWGTCIRSRRRRDVKQVLFLSL